MLSFSDLKLNKVIVFNEQPYIIIKCDFLRMQQAKPTKKCKMRNLIDGSILEYTFKSGENVEEADISRQKATFMYSDQNSYSFMLIDTYETIDLDQATIGPKTDYLKPELEVEILYFGEKVIGVDLPLKVSFEVVETQEVTKGNSVSDIDKDAKIETGKIIKVPPFIKVGEKIIIKVDEDKYVERDNVSKK